MAFYRCVPGGSGVPVADSGSGEGSLAACWADMCAGTTIGDGDEIRLADGTYDDTTADVPVAGLGDCSQNIDLTIAGEGGDYSACIVDFTGNNSGVDGFHIASTGTWTFKDLTIHGSDAGANEGEISIQECTLNLQNMEIYNDASSGRGNNGVHGWSTNGNECAIYALNVYFHDLFDCISIHVAGDGGTEANRIVEARFCKFKDINYRNGINNCQGITTHTGAVARAYFCEFDNIDQSGDSGEGDAMNCAGFTGMYGCTVVDCYRGILSTGEIDVRNSHLATTGAHCVVSSSAATTDLGAVTIDTCILKTSASLNSTISLPRASDITIKNSIIYATCSGSTTSVIHNYTATNAAYDGKTLTVEDNFIYSEDTSNHYLITASHQNVNIKRNLIYCEHDTDNGLIRLYYNQAGNKTAIDFNCNAIYKVGTPGEIFDVRNSGTGATYTGGGNTWPSGVGIDRRSVISAKDSDLVGTITLTNKTTKMLTPTTSPFYRDFGVVMMYGWYNPTTDNNGVRSPYAVLPDRPSTPSITSVTDDGNEDSVTVAVTGSGTIQLYYRLVGATSWTTGQSRSGSGDITQTGLTAGSWYEFYATDTVDGFMSDPSGITTAMVIDSSLTTIETAIYSKLTADATVDSLVSTRIFPNIVPQGESMPAVTYQMISAVPQETTDTAQGWRVGRFQITCWAETYSGAKELSEAVRKDLHRYSGTVNGVVIDSIMLENELDAPQLAAETDVLKRHGKILEFEIWFEEATS